MPPTPLPLAVGPTDATTARLGEHPGALAGPPVDWAALRRVLVVRPDNAGDVLMLGPALRALRLAAPRASVDLLCSPGGAAAAALLPEVDATLVASPSWQHAGTAPPPDPDVEAELVRRIAAGRYDAAVIVTSFSQSPYPAAYACLLAGVPLRIGAAKEFGGALLSTWVPAPPDEVHQVDRSLLLLARAGVTARAGSDLRVRVPADGAQAAADALRRLGVAGPYAVLLPGASCPSRRWSPAGFAAVAERLAAEGLRPLVVGTSSERGLVDAVTAEAPASLGLTGELDLGGLAALLGGAGVAVTNNSGGMHLADAVRAPLVVLFAGTEDESQYAPRSTAASVLRVPTPCSPCRAFRCPYAAGTATGVPPCLDLDPAAVAAAALSAARR